MRTRGRAGRATNRGATAWNDRENDGNWGQKLRCVFEIDVPQNTILRVSTTYKPGHPTGTWKPSKFDAKMTVLPVFRAPPSVSAPRWLEPGTAPRPDSPSVDHRGAPLPL